MERGKMVREGGRWRGSEEDGEGEGGWRGREEDGEGGMMMEREG